MKDRFYIDPDYPFDHERSTPSQVCILEQQGISDRYNRSMLICEQSDAANICAALNKGWEKPRPTLKKLQWLFIALVSPIVIYSYYLRLEYPELTETQLFLTMIGAL